MEVVTVQLGWDTKPIELHQRCVLETKHLRRHGLLPSNGDGAFFKLAKAEQAVAPFVAASPARKLRSAEIWELMVPHAAEGYVRAAFLLDIARRLGIACSDEALASAVADAKTRGCCAVVSVPAAALALTSAPGVALPMATIATAKAATATAKARSVSAKAKAANATSARAMAARITVLNHGCQRHSS